MPSIFSFLVMKILHTSYYIKDYFQQDGVTLHTANIVQIFQFYNKKCGLQDHQTLTHVTSSHWCFIHYQKHWMI